MKKLSQNLSLIWSCILLMLSFFSCQDTVKINIPTGKSTLSVDAVLTNRGTGDTIKLSNTTTYFSDSTFSPFKGAKVILSDSSGSSENLVEISPGIFPIKNTHAQINHTYYLDIYTNTDHFRATTKINRLSPTLDSIRYEYQSKTVQYDTAGYYIYFYGQELPVTGDHAWIRVYRNNILLSVPRDIFAIDDEFTDGKYYSGVSIRTQEAFKDGDIVRVEIWSITKDTYQFLEQIQTQTNNRGIFQTTPANVPTNILNASSVSNTQATGYFIGSLVESISEPIYN